MLAEAAEAEQSIRHTRPNFANRETTMTALRTPYGAALAYHSKGPPFQSPTCHHTSPGPDRVKPEHLKYLPLVLINTLARLSTRYQSESKIPKQWKTSKIVLLYRKGGSKDIDNYSPICLLSVIYKLFTRIILNRIEGTLHER
ncbi:hypothetical protein RB195_023080 [Necator americanus]|uniref:Reverse transcriptase domain-containing protein n=1 Tax=Necator americanus TaxID=51031 RepID=A0ABR1EK14_NECAM